MDLKKLHHIYRFSKNVIEPAQEFISLFDQTNPTYLFVEDGILHGSTILDYTIFPSKTDLSKTETITLNLVAAFKERVEITLVMDKTFNNHPIILPDGLLRQNDMWKFESFSQLKYDIKDILEIPADFVVLQKRAYQIIDNLISNKITKTQYDIEIRPYLAHNKFLAIDIKKTFIERFKYKKQEQLKSVTALFNTMVTNGEMTNDEREYFLKVLISNN